MARKSIEITATLFGAVRLYNSANGNPRWGFRTSEGELKTQSDAGIGYSVNNHLGRPEHNSESWIGREVVFIATPSGRVFDWRLATLCQNCGEAISPDADNGWIHTADDVAGCGTENAESAELYATPAN